MVAMRLVAALMAFFTATRARSWLEPAVRARLPRPVARASSIVTGVEWKILGWRAQDRDVPGVPAGLVLAAMTLRARFFAAMYDRQMAKTEEAGVVGG